MARQRAGCSGPPDDRAARLAAWVEASCVAQGVPVKITDRALLAQVAELVRERPAQKRQNGSRRDSSKRL
jgi:hypothetical protein